MNKLYIGSIQNLSNEDFNLYYSKASIQRKEKIDAFRFINDSKLSLMAEMLLRYALKENKLNEDINYLYNENKKPYLKDNIYFNLSHSGDYAICAISENEVGCDIEKIKDVNLKIAKRFFYEEEYNNVLKDNKLFFRYWTLKESYLKAKGIGIKGLDNAKIDIESSTINNDNKYHLYELNIIDGYNIALCLSNNENYEYEIITSEKLKEKLL